MNVAVGLSAEQDLSREGQERQSAASISGTVVDATSGTPLANIVVRWTADALDDKSEAVVLGQSISAPDGTFTISAYNTTDVEEVLCRSRHRVSFGTYLETGRENERLRVDPNLDEILLRIDGDGEPPDDVSWKDAAEYLMTQRLLRASELAAAIAKAPEGSPFASWNANTRAAALGRMVALGGKPPAEQDQFLHFPSLLAGDLVVALSKFQKWGDVFVEDQADLDLIIELPTNKIQLYRDYLRSTWVSAATEMYRNNPPLSTAPSDSVLIRQIEWRFLQDFRTSDNSRKPAARLLAQILIQALQRAKLEGGFGILPTAIPAQGTQTDDEYLTTLIALSGEDPVELRNRFRVEFVRPVGTQVTPVELNIEALLGLLADTWQSPPEPFMATPPFRDQLPLIFPRYSGNAPFFLQYEEWLERQLRFFPENVYDIRRNIPQFPQTARSFLKDFPGKAVPSTAIPGHFADVNDIKLSCRYLLEDVIANADRINGAMAQAQSTNYEKAVQELTGVQSAIKAGLPVDSGPKPPLLAWHMDRFEWENPNGSITKEKISLRDRAKAAAKTREDLSKFESWFDMPYVELNDNVGKYRNLARARALSIWWRYYAYYVLIPYLRSTIYMTVGNYAGALRDLGQLTGYVVGVAETLDAPGYASKASSQLYSGTTLPYTTTVGFDSDGNYYPLEPKLGGESIGFLTWDVKRAIAPFEQEFFKLAQGDVMLAWADQLYRNDDPSSIRRARELFKGVLFMHGEDPRIAPAYQFTWAQIPLPVVLAQENPARMSQIWRASLGLWQIQQGLNVYGYRDDMVPVLRYKPLKQAADLFAASAKSAQTDFLQYVTRFEQAQIEGWQATAMVKKAEASLAIAGEQVEIAKVGVAKAQEQVAAVKAQIAAKQAEIANKDSFFEQAKDFFGGMKDTFEGMVPAVERVMNDTSPAGVASADQLKEILGKGLSSPSAAKQQAIQSLGAGAGIAFAFGAFAVNGYKTMEAMAEAAAKRAAELKGLQEGALPAAEAMVKFKERDVTIANRQKDIANADLALARALQRFQQDRFLNVDLWNKLAAFAQRLMRRYLELGASAGWMAERAIAYEQNRPINVIRMNYFPVGMRGLTGADRLLLDLAELEANRIQGVRLSTPVKHTISLAREYPFQFGQLKKQGVCQFQTTEASLLRAYPGTFGYRIRAVTIAVQDAEGPAPRGILRNSGISIVSGEGGKVRSVRTRFADALPLSEFRLQDDLFVFGLPGETLLQFEGSGYETGWELELPPQANQKGLTTLTDVLITFDMNAQYSQPAAAPAAGPVTINQAFFMAASVFDSGGLATLRSTATGPARIEFDLRQVPLRAQETNRTITNLGVILAGNTDKTFQGKLRATLSPTEVSFPITGGYVMSNAGLLLGTNTPLPLNALVGLPVNQPLTLEIDKTGVANELRALFDVVLYVEYQASV